MIKLASLNRFTSSLNAILQWFGKYSLELYVLHLLILKTPEILSFFSERELIITGISFALLMCKPYSSLSKRITGFAIR